MKLTALRVQVVEDGYEFFARRQLVTIFSAPNYCGEFDNAGAMMSVDETLMCSFQVQQYFIRNFDEPQVCQLTCPGFVSHCWGVRMQLCSALEVATPLTRHLEPCILKGCQGYSCLIWAVC